MSSLPEQFSLQKVFSISNVRWLKCVNGGDAFMYPSFGCIVTWGLSQDSLNQLLTWVKDYEVGPFPNHQKDSYNYTISSTNKRFDITKRIEMITLSNPKEDHENLTEKFAISYAFAQSVSLFGIEDNVLRLSEKVENFPDQLARYGTVNITKREIVRQLGEQMRIKSYLNLHSDIIDTPEHFWEHPEGEGIYRIARSHVEIDKRIRIMNERLNLISSMYDVINDEHKHSHSIRLERIIIALIAIEAAFGFLNYFGSI
eukprot:gene4560-5682_t